MGEIFVQAFHLDACPDMETSFGELGGTSLDAMHALITIRQKVFEKMDISLLFANPSVRQLAAALEPLLASVDESAQEQHEDDEDFSVRPRASWLIETLGILFPRVAMVVANLFSKWITISFASIIICLTNTSIGVSYIYKSS